jgi:hypothetical protein
MLVYNSLNEPVTTSISGYRYGGCWNDPDSNPYLPNRLPSSSTGSTGMTLQECIQYGKTGGYNSIAYKNNGTCYAGNQGTNGVNYKQGGELSSDDAKCNVLSPGPNSSIIYTTYGTDNQAVINGYEYKGCYNDQSPSFTTDLAGYSYTLDECITAAKNGGYGLAAFLNENECKVATQGVGSDYTQYGQVSDASKCNSHYPGLNSAIVYSTSTDVSSSNYYNIMDQITDIFGHFSTPTSQVSGYSFRGYWNESPDRAVTDFLGAYSLDECISRAKTAGYDVVSLQNTNQCWAGRNSNYKKYGQATSASINTLNNYIAEIYSTSSEPSAYVECGAHTESLENMNMNTPQPSYNTPQTTTVTFNHIPDTNAIITYSQNPISATSTATAAPLSTPSSLSSSSPVGSSISSNIAATSNSPPSSSTAPLNQRSLNNSWLPNTPFVYENNRGSGNSNDKNTPSRSPATPTPNTTSNSSSPMSSSMFSNLDIINNQYSSVTTPNPVEPFTYMKVTRNITKNASSKEGITSISPPPKEIPGAFVPKSVIVPPVCPSIPPVIIKTDCSACKKEKKTEDSSMYSNLTDQMTSNYANSNAIYGKNPYSTDCYFDNKTGTSDCNKNNRSYDNIPQPYLPSFSGFGI